VPATPGPSSIARCLFRSRGSLRRGTKLWYWQRRSHSSGFRIAPSVVLLYRSDNHPKADGEESYRSEPRAHTGVDDLIICEVLAFRGRSRSSGFRWRHFPPPFAPPAPRRTYRRPRRLLANACVCEYELFQRSKATPPARPAVAARPATPITPRPLALLAAMVATPLTVLAAPAAARLAFLVTARPRPFLMAAVTRPDDLPLALSLKGATEEMGADFLRDVLRPLLFLERFAMLDLALALCVELLRGRAGVERRLRLLLAEPLRPVRFVVVWAICPPFRFRILPPALFALPRRCAEVTDRRGHLRNISRPRLGGSPGRARPIWPIGMDPRKLARGSM
jgi:hypothetical protein